MDSHFQKHSSGSGSGSRRALNGTMPYLSERQTQAYLMARDTIRRIQRTASIVDSIANDAADKLRSANRRLDSH